MNAFFTNGRGVWVLLVVAVCVATAEAQSNDAFDPAVATVHEDEAARAALESEMIALLESDASWREKFRACRMLGVIGSERNVPALVALLHDEQLGSVARVALEPMPYDEVGAALREALEKSRGGTRLGIIASLAQRRDAQAVEAMVRLTHEDEATASAAALALGHIGTDEAARRLAELRNAAQGEVRSAAAEASLMLAEHRLAAQQTDEAVALYGQLHDPDWPLHIRTGAFLGLLNAEPSQAAARVLAAIQGEDDLFRAVAIGAVATLPGEGVTARLAAQLSSLPAAAQVEMIAALAQREDPAAQPALLNAAADEHESVRLAALQALSTVGDASTVDPLCELIPQLANRPQRLAMVETLRRLSGTKVDEALIACLRRLPLEHRAMVIDALQQRGSVTAVDELLAQTHEPTVRAAAFRALGQLASQQHLSVLVQRLIQLPDERGRREAEQAVVLTAQRLDDENEHSAHVVDVLAQTPEPMAQASLLRVLSGLGGEAAHEAVVGHLDADEPRLRDAAVRALADWPDVRAIGTLADVFAKTQDAAHRGLALRGVVRLLRAGDLSMEDTLRHYAALSDAAESADERKLILSGLADVKDTAAMKMVGPFTNDASVRIEAELALLKIGETLVEKNPQVVRPMAERLQQNGSDPRVREQAAALLKRLSE